LNRHDAEEGVPGAVAPTLPPREIIRGVVVAAIVLLAAWLVRHWQLYTTVSPLTSSEWLLARNF
jgi:hypothetical protein